MDSFTEFRKRTWRNDVSSMATRAVFPCLFVWVCWNRESCLEQMLIEGKSRWKSRQGVDFIDAWVFLVFLFMLFLFI